ncbi:SA1362 family protein [Sediminibacillus massiliensis]|uniref:SA1362 family protein n=1 Tax=Sediminibacillus massiliensis TaxID=1926277 RepID=UPI0009883CF2|nr:SA1362 family protein [Sediminibacillus massiliensis]
MYRNKLSLFVYVLIGLAVLGFATQLFTDTASLLKNLLIMVAIGAIIYGVVHYFFLRKRTSNELKKYKKAVKQSKMKYKEDTTSKKAFSQATKKSPLTKHKKPSKARATHLRVIDGNKQKSKNRATF